MLVLDNSVLSAFTFLNIVDLLSKLQMPIAVPKAVVDEYTEKWPSENLLNWIEVVELGAESLLQAGDFPRGMSKADIQILSLAMEKEALLASDDKLLRKTAKSTNIKVTGSIGLLKLLYLKKIIKDSSTYIELLEKMQTDLYLSEEVIKWAREGI